MVQIIPTDRFPLPRLKLGWETLPSQRSEEALGLWRQLELRVGESSVCSSATWTECWLNVFGQQISHQFLVARSAGVVQGIVLIANGIQQKDGPFNVKTFHVGTAGEPLGASVCVEYNRLLVDPAFHSEFVDGVVQHVQRQKNWEQFRIDGFSEPELADWIKHFPDAEIRFRDSKFFDFRATREVGQEILARLGSSTRSNIRRRLKAYGELTTEWAENVEQATEIFEELIQLHQARWQAVGQPGAFHDAQFLQFQRESCVKLFLEQKAVAFRVRHQGETVGCLYLLNDRNRLLDYLSGFAPFEKKPSPGLISHYLCMNHAAGRGYDAYDFLVGDKQHKANLSTDSINLCWMVARRKTWKATALHGLRFLKRSLSRPPKQAEP